MRRLSVHALAVAASAFALDAAPAFAAPVELPPPAPVANGFCGTSVATGDVNDDGHDDVVVGCPRDSAGATATAGSVLVFVRNAANTGFDAPVTLTHPQPTALDRCGSDVATGDVNADGRDDVIMGCDGDGITGASNTGSAVVLRRNAANTGFDAGVVLTGSTQADNDSCADVAAGDVTGDGRADVVVGCNASGATNTGLAYVHVSSAGGSFTNGALAPPAPAESFDRCGSAVAIGDVSGDGQPDVVVGCFGRGVRGGAIVYRHTSGASFTGGADVEPGAGTGPCGDGVAVGDVNGDALADLAIGCYQVTPPGTTAFSGAAAVRLATGGGAFGDTTWLYPPAPVSSAACAQNLTIAEVGGDAHRDVVMGCANDGFAGTAKAGTAVTFLRATSNAGFAAGTQLGLATPAADDKCGYDVAAGDVDGDTGGDIVIGCYQRDVGGTASAGIAALFPGTPPTPVAPVIPVEPTRPPDPAPAPAPAPAPPAPAATGGDRSPTSVTASVTTVTAVPVNADGSYTSPAVACGESGICVVVMDSRTTPPATRAASSAAKKKQEKSASISVAKARFTVAAGKRGTAKMKLSTRGKALLRKRGTLRITTTITVTDPSKNSRRFTAKTTLKKGKLR